MIKFFRKIRQNMIKDHKVSKYMLYATGEIVLVVIGILIALGINNWNEHRKQHNNDIEFLKSLKNELVLDSISISNRITFYYKINNDITESIKLLDTSTVLTATQIKFISETIEITEILLPTYKNLDRNGFMISSGALHRVNPDINTNYLNYLDSFKLSYDLGNKMTTSLNESINNELYPNVDLNFTNPSQNHVTFDLMYLKNNRTFINALQKSIWYRDTVLVNLEPLLEEATSLIQQIDQQLNTHLN